MVLGVFLLANIFMFLFSFDEKIWMSLLVYFSFFFCWHQISKSINFIFLFSVPPSLTLHTLPTCICAALNSQLASSTVPITASTQVTLTQHCFYSSRPILLFCSLLHVLQLQLPSGSVYSFITCHCCFYLHNELYCCLAANWAVNIHLQKSAHTTHRSTSLWTIK